MDRTELMARTAENIRTCRKAKGMSQEALALEAGLNPAFLGHIERCLKCPTIDTLNKIAIALDIPLSQLLTFPETYTKSPYQDRADEISAALSTLSPEAAERAVDLFLNLIHLVRTGGQ